MRKITLESIPCFVHKLVCFGGRHGGKDGQKSCLPESITLIHCFICFFLSHAIAKSTQSCASTLSVLPAFAALIYEHLDCNYFNLNRSLRYAISFSYWMSTNYLLLKHSRKKAAVSHGDADIVQARPVKVAILFRFQLSQNVFLNQIAMTSNLTRFCTIFVYFKQT